MLLMQSQSTSRATVSESIWETLLRFSSTADRFFPNQSLLKTPHGGWVELKENQYFLKWPDSTALRVDVNPGYLSVFLDLPDARHGRINGLFGNFDSNPENEIVTRQGAVIQSLTGKQFSDALYHSFGRSWRISQTESLFDYAPGKSTRNYTDLSFPDGSISADGLRSARGGRPKRNAGGRSHSENPF